MVMQQAGIIDPRELQQARQNPRVQMAEGLASSGIAGALKELIHDRVTIEAMELVAAADRDEAAKEAAKMTDKPSIKDSNTQGINQLVQTLAPGMQLRNNQIQKAQMQKMLGLGGQPAPNMRLADGGIVGFEEGDKVEGNNFSRHEFMYGPILRKLGIGPMYDFGGGLNEDFMNRRKKRAAVEAAVEKYGPDAAMPVGSNQPIPMLMQKYGSEMVMKYLEGQKELKEESKFVAPEYRDAFKQKEANFMSNFPVEFVVDVYQTQSGPLGLRYQQVKEEQEAGMGLSPMAPMAPIPTPLNAIRRPQRGSKMADGGIVALKEGGFPDLSGDGKVTQKDILMGRGVVDKAQGGIVGFDNGGSVIPQVGIFGPAIYDFTDFLVSKGIENISDLSSSAIESLTREFEEQKAAGDVRTELADMGDAPGSRGTPQARPRPAESEEQAMTEEQLMIAQDPLGFSRARGLLEDLPEEPPLSEFQQNLRDIGELNIEQQLLDAQRRMELGGRKRLPTPGEEAASRRRELRMSAPDVEGKDGYDFSALADGLGISGLLDTAKDVGKDVFMGGYSAEELLNRTMPTRMQTLGEGRGLLDLDEYEQGAVGREMFTFVPSYLSNILFPNPENERLGTLTVGEVGEAIEPRARGFLGLGRREQAQDETEAAKDIIAEGGTPTGEVNLEAPSIEKEGIQVGDVAPSVKKGTETAEQVQAGLAAFDSDVSTGTGTGTETGTGTGTETESAVNALGALELSGEGSGAGLRDQVKRIIDREEDPVRIALDFGRAFGKGNTPFQGLQLGGEVLDAAENKLDTQITALERLIQAADITDAQMRIAQEELAVKREQIDAIRSGNLYDLLASIQNVAASQERFNIDRMLRIEEYLLEKYGDQFSLTDMEIKQSIAELGYDPNSPEFGALVRQTRDRMQSEDRARLIGPLQ